MPEFMGSGSGPDGIEMVEEIHNAIKEIELALTKLDNTDEVPDGLIDDLFLIHKDLLSRPDLLSPETLQRTPPSVLKWLLEEILERLLWNSIDALGDSDASEVDLIMKISNAIAATEKATAELAKTEFPEERVISSLIKCSEILRRTSLPPAEVLQRTPSLVLSWILREVLEKLEFEKDILIIAASRESLRKLRISGVDIGLISPQVIAALLANPLAMKTLAEKGVKTTNN